MLLRILLIVAAAEAAVMMHLAMLRVPVGVSAVVLDAALLVLLSAPLLHLWVVRPLARDLSDRYFRDLVQHLDAVVCDVDAATLRTTFVSRRVEEVLGHPTERWTEVPELWRGLLHPDDRERAVAARREAASRGGRYVCEYRLRSAGGRDVWIRERGRAVRDPGGRVRSLQILMGDLSELRHSQESSREVDEMLHAVIRASPLGIVALARDGTVRLWNPAAEAILGFQVEEAVGRPLPIGSLEKEPESKALRDRVLGGESFAGVEITWLRKDGAAVDLSLSAAPLHDAEGSIVGILGILEDISASRHADRCRRARLEAMGAVSGAASFAEAGRGILEVICRNLGWSFGEMWSLDRDTDRLRCTTVWHHEEERLARFAAHTFATAPAPDQGLAGKVWHSGRPVWLEDVGRDEACLRRHEAVEAGLRDAVGIAIPCAGSVVGVLLFFHSRIPEPDGELLETLSAIAGQCGQFLGREKTEAERSRLASALEHAVECVLITDRDGSILYVNRAFERVTGYARGEVLGKNPRLLKSGNLDASVYAGMWSTILAGEVWSGHLRNRRKDGTLYEVESVVSPVLDPGGAVVSFVAVQRDVTRERRLEEQLRQAQRMEAIGTLAAGIAHDFNNLLTAVNGFAELTLLQLGQSPALYRNVEEIRRAGDRAASLTRQLLAFGRRQVLTPQVLDLNEVVGNLAEMLRRLIGEDIEIHIAAASDLGRVKADPAQMEQVLMNLVVNARDAMPAGGRLRIETANVDLDARWAADHVGVTPGPHVMLCVADTGHGMDAATQARAFEPFFTTKEKGRGTGLGLSTVHGIVNQSGGHIWIYSEVGQGTTFKVYLPRVDEAPERLRAAVQPEPRGGTETILVAEDDSGVRSVVETILRSRGYTVLAVATPAEALAVCDVHPGPIHLLLTDVVLPEMNGPELARRLGAVRSGVKQLYMSGYTDEEIVQRGALRPGVRFLQKPFTLDGLVAKVRQALDSEADG